MTDQQHPITPPPELVQQWLGEYFGCTVNGELSESEKHLATQAANWGADKELNECCKWLPKLPPWSADDLRKHRRPKPPSLKELALDGLQRIETNIPQSLKEFEASCDAIRRALEQLDG